ncbi:MAG: isopentenyl phosphate kinase [Zestosphaera sp.]
MRTAVKFGGSAITWKSEPLSIRSDVLVRLAGELSVFRARHRDHELVVVHGGGSFGHPLVEECLHSTGYIDEECFSRVAFYMDFLNHVVVEALMSSELPAVRISPRSICRGVGYTDCNMDVVGGLIDAGVVPVLYGDVILTKDGFKVVSGDDLVWYLTKSIGVERVVFVTDVDGVYDKDPRVASDAKVLSGMRVNEVLEAAEFWGVHDVTGGMLGKLRKPLLLGIRGVEVYVVNGLIPGNLLNALEGKKVVGSVLWV